MAEQSFGSAALVLKTETSQLEQGLNKGQESVTAFIGKVNNSFSVVSSNPYIAALSAAVGQVLGKASELFDTFKNKVNQVFDDINDHWKKGMQLGLGTASFERMLAGSKIGADELVVSLSHMERSVGQFRQGGKEATDAFGLMGLTLENVSGDGEAQFRAITNAIRGMQDQTLKANAVQAIFGRQGRALLPQIENGIDEATQAAIRQGRVVTDSQAEAVHKLKQTWQETEHTITGIWTQLAVKALPIFQKAADALLGIWNFIKPAFDKGVEVAGKFFNFLAAGWDTAANYLAPFVAAVQNFFGQFDFDSDAMVETLLTLTEEWGKFLGKILITFQPMIKGFMLIGAGALEMGQGVIATWKSIAPAAIVWLDGMIKATQTFLSAVIEPIMKGMETLIRFIADLMFALPDKIKDAIPGFRDMGNALDASADAAAMFGRNIHDMATTNIDLGDPHQFDAMFDGLSQDLATAQVQLENWAAQFGDITEEGIKDWIEARMAEWRANLAQATAAARAHPAGETLPKQTDMADKLQQSKALLFGSAEAQNLIYQNQFSGNDALGVMRETANHTRRAANGIEAMLQLQQNNAQVELSVV